MNREGRGFRRRACRHCGGDGWFDGSEDSGRCLQCGRAIVNEGMPVGPAASGADIASESAPSTRHATDTWMARHRRRRRASSVTSIAMKSKQGSNFEHSRVDCCWTRGGLNCQGADAG
jgi:hypothetical protein